MEIELCHWLLQEPSGNCRNVFAPAGDTFEGYWRVGPAAYSEQFVMPMCYAISESQVGCELTSPMNLRLLIQRDEHEAQGSAFLGMTALKIATLISEMSNCIAQWVHIVGCRFHSIQIVDSGSGEIRLNFSFRDETPVAKQRALNLIKAGIEMMAYSRGLRIEKCDSWAI